MHRIGLSGLLARIRRWVTALDTLADEFHSLASGPLLRVSALQNRNREALLEAGRLREAVLTPADLDRASAVACFNSLRGWMPARLQRAGGTSTVGLASGSRSG